MILAEKEVVPSTRTGTFSPIPSSMKGRSEIYGEYIPDIDIAIHHPKGGVVVKGSVMRSPEPFSSIPIKHATKFVKPSTHSLSPEFEKKRSAFGSTSERFVEFSPENQQGPGQYQSHNQVETENPSLSKKGSGGFASSTKRFDTRSKELSLKRLPGPGYYYDPEKNSSFIPPDHKIRSVVVMHQPSHPQSNLPKESAPGPGSYKQELPNLTHYPHSITANAAFASSTTRYFDKELERLAKAPGPGYYDPILPCEYIEDYHYSSSFQSTSKQLHHLHQHLPDSYIQNNNTPGPGFYNTNTNTNNNNNNNNNNTNNKTNKDKPRKAKILRGSISPPAQRKARTKQDDRFSYIPRNKTPSPVPLEKPIDAQKRGKNPDSLASPKFVKRPPSPTHSQTSSTSPSSHTPIASIPSKHHDTSTKKIAASPYLPLTNPEIRTNIPPSGAWLASQSPIMRPSSTFTSTTERTELIDKPRILVPSPTDYNANKHDKKPNFHFNASYAWV